MCDKTPVTSFKHFCAALCMTTAVSSLPAYAQLNTPSAQADAIRINRIAIDGNQRIESSTIKTYLGISEGSVISQSELNQALKNLYETGFFADAIIGLNGDALNIRVIENPSINQVAFEGNDAMDDEDLEKEINLRSRSIYTRTKVQNDVKRLLDVYRRSGRYSAKIDPKIITLEQNRVNLVYEIEEGEKTYIDRINFIGNSAFDSSTLRKVVSSEETAFYKLLTSSDVYDPDRLEYDKELLRRFYLSEGYADFKVKSGIAELTPDRDAFYLTYTIEEGQPYTLSKVSVEGELAKKQKLPDFNEDITTIEGERYNATAVENTIENMVEKLGDKGFAFVDIEPKLERNEDDGTIELAYHIEEGPRVYVDRIDITGNVRTIDEVIRREFRIAEGDPYNSSKLKRSEQRLNNLGFFEKVTFETTPGDSEDKTIVNVDVEEKSTGEVSFGAGFSTTDGALTDFGIRERNLLGRGQDLRFRAMLAAERQQFDIGFTEPYFLNREVAAGFDLFKTTQDFRSESSFDRDSIGGALRLGYKLSERLRHNIKYSFEENEITNVRDDASRFVRDQEGKSSTSLIGHAFTYDDRDNRFQPTSGWYWRLNQEVAGLGGDAQFLRHEAQTEYYIPLAEKWTLLTAASGGHIYALDDDIEIQHRFFVGGRELRGFDNSGIGPRDITTEDALGGNTYYTATAELQFPLGLPEELGFTGALFVDAGSLWDVDDTGPEVVDDTSVRVAGGIGIGWASPFGPIRIDFASPFVKEDYDITENFRFSFGTRF